MWWFRSRTRKTWVKYLVLIPRPLSMHHHLTFWQRALHSFSGPIFSCIFGFYHLFCLVPLTDILGRRPLSLYGLKNHALESRTAVIAPHRVDQFVIGDYCIVCFDRTQCRLGLFDELRLALSLRPFTGARIVSMSDHLLNVDHTTLAEVFGNKAKTKFTL